MNIQPANEPSSLSVGSSSQPTPGSLGAFQEKIVIFESKGKTSPGSMQNTLNGLRAAINQGTFDRIPENHRIQLKQLKEKVIEHIESKMAFDNFPVVGKLIRVCYDLFGFATYAKYRVNRKFDEMRGLLDKNVPIPFISITPNPLFHGNLAQADLPIQPDCLCISPAAASSSQIQGLLGDSSSIAQPGLASNPAFGLLAPTPALSVLVNEPAVASHPAGAVPYKVIRTPLQRAIPRGSIEVVRALIDQFPDQINDLDQEKETLLFKAVLHGNLDVVRLLLEKAPNQINSRDLAGNTLLHTAVRWKELDVIRLLLEKCPLLIETKNGVQKTPLMYAFLLGRIDIITLLLDKIRQLDQDSRNKLINPVLDGVRKVLQGEELVDLTLDARSRSQEISDLLTSALR